MKEPKNIDAVLQAWTFRPGVVVARRVKGDDGRSLVQMRLDMGLLQMEPEGRPDGQNFGEHPTYCDYLASLAVDSGDEFELDEDQCEQIDREFVQFYHRRVCWLSLREFRRACEDADHTLRLMDISTLYTPDDQWAFSHEQYRPFVLFHRVQAAALAELEDFGAEAAIEELDNGIVEFEQLYASYHDDEEDEEDEEDELELDHDEDTLVARLQELRQSICEHYEVEQDLTAQLAEAIAAEEFERAARLRDEIARRRDDSTGEF